MSCQHCGSELYKTAEMIVKTCLECYTSNPDPHPWDEPGVCCGGNNRDVKCIRCGMDPAIAKKMEAF